MSSTHRKKYAPRLTDSQKEEIYRLYEEGLTFQAIGEKYNKTREAIRQVCKKANLPARRHMANYTIGRMLDLIAGGITEAKELADELQVSLGTVYTAIRRAKDSGKLDPDFSTRVTNQKRYIKEIESFIKEHEAGHPTDPWDSIVNDWDFGKE